MYLKKVLYLTLALGFGLSGCTKKLDSNSPGVTPPPGSTIQATGGTNQTDTLGGALLDSIVVKINEPGSKLNKYLVKIFQQTLCNGDSTSQQWIINGHTVSYKWTLGDAPGIQTLKFQVLDSAQKIVDSINVTATAKPPTPGWHPSGCLVKKTWFLSTFGKTSTGRIYTGFDGCILPYYSDDNGVTWHTLPSFHFGYYPDVEKIQISPTDEIYIGSELNGVFYSADNGKTWENRVGGLPPLTPISDLALTPGGQLFFTGTNRVICISKDKGESWTTVQSADDTFLGSLKYSAQDGNGNIYFCETNDATYLPVIKVLDHATNAITLLSNLPLAYPSAFYIDQNNNWYAGGFNNTANETELYQSADGGKTWKKVFTMPNDGSSYMIVDFMSRQSDGSYYFEVLGQKIYIYKTPDFVNFQNIQTAVPGYSGVYIVAANGNFIMNSFPISIWYNVP
jgi:hypothetical protein